MRGPHRAIGLTAVVAVSILFSAVPAGAGQTRRDVQGFPYRRPAPPPRDLVGVRLFVLSDRTDMTASRTFDAVIGTSEFVSRGGGGEVIRVWKGLFARVAATTLKESGSRVVVFGNDAIPLGIPLSLEMQQVEMAAGWRFNDHDRSRIVAYAGGGLLRLRYKESSEFADPADTNDERFNGSAVFGGIDVSIWKWFMVGAEAQYRAVPDAIGTGGVSKAFSETDLGGLTVRVLAGIRR